MATYTMDSAASDLFGGELGEYELNEIPSLFNLDSQQMSVDLETLGFSASGPSPSSEDVSAEGDLPIGEETSRNNNVMAAPQVKNEPAAPASTTLVGATSQAMAAKKRSAAEISEDEDASTSSSSNNTAAKTTKKQSTRRVTRSAIKPMGVSSSAAAAGTTNRKLLAPKPTKGGTAAAAAANTISAPTSPASSGTISMFGGRQIDTSTEHVKALTGNKGAAMCFETFSGTNLDTTVAIPNLANSDLSPEEKAKFSRDRNRLHAKNTRIRKKAYVDELKRTLDVLVKERDTAQAAKNRKVQVEMEERDVRYSVVEEFLRLRGSNDQTPARWNAILEETVTLCLPQLDWNKAKSATAAGSPSKKLLSGVTELMKECNDFSKNLKKGSKKTSVGSLSFQCDRSSLLMEGANVVMDWTANSIETTKPFTLRGTCRAKFNPQSNKLHSVELFFDSTPLM